MNKEQMNQITENSSQWAAAKPEKLPRLTFWPITLAAGIVFVFWGFITSVIISFAGLAGTAVSIWGWIEGFSDEN